MLRALFSDPRALRAWLLTKAAVLAAAAGATWALARVLGPRAWTAYAVFAAVLVLTTLAVIAAARPSAHGRTLEDEKGETADPEPESRSDLPVAIPVEDSLDLHPFPPAEIPDVVRTYLDEAVVRGHSEVRLIHGRGVGVQRERVRAVLAKHPTVLEYHDAPPSRGGWGATVVRLRTDAPLSTTEC